jgi:hypothetical protein
MCKSLGGKLYSLSLSLSYLLALVFVSLPISLSQDLLESGLLPEFCCSGEEFELLGDPGDHCGSCVARE